MTRVVFFSWRDHWKLSEGQPEPVAMTSGVCVREAEAAGRGGDTDGKGLLEI